MDYIAIRQISTLETFDIIERDEYIMEREEFERGFIRVAEIGSQLREAREALQLSLLEVEKETRIRRSFLQAMEQDRFSDLPWDIYTRGFLRNYALFLNLDPQPLLDEYDTLHTEPVQYVPLVLDEPLLPSRQVNIGGRIFFIIMATIVLSLLGWLVYNRIVAGSGLISSLRVGRTTAPTITLTIPTVKPANDSEEPAPVPSATPAILPTITPLPEPTIAATATLSPTATDPVVAGIQVKAEVLSDTWVIVTVDGEPTFQGTLAAGDQLSWVAQSTLALHLGNAGGISVTVNGVTVGLLGEIGEVKDIEYTLDTLPQPAP